MKAALLISCLTVSVAFSAETAPDFNRDIRPILSNNCFYCHGPDEKERKGGKNGLRLDTPEGLREDLGGYAAVVSGQPEKSELIKRILTTDEDDVMPPGKTGKKLTAHEVDLLKRWITGGGQYSRHWSYEKPVRPKLPEVRGQQAEIKNGIDNFVFARLENVGLKPQPEADVFTLARRVALDLTGLPPTMEEVDSFAKDCDEMRKLEIGMQHKKPDDKDVAVHSAFDRFVDKMLAKESYGEHMARTWLDLARYADSAGYADDPPRMIWAYRDYVIRAFNKNTPFDQFTIEQIAGDLLPDAGQEQLVATAFHRNTMTNSEGGTNDEEFRNAAVVDRVNTTLAVWMGTSMACAQCHSHKFDPISQKEYFSVFAILNNTADSDKKDESPVLALPMSEEKTKRREALQAELAALETKLKMTTPELIAATAKWAQEFQSKSDTAGKTDTTTATVSAAKKDKKPKSIEPPAPVLAALRLNDEKRSEAQRRSIEQYYLHEIAPELKTERERSVTVKKELDALKPDTVPVMRETGGKDHRKTFVQLRGNFQQLADEVSEGVPAAWHPLPKDAPRNRLTLAKWLMDADNPLTSRVVANRLWEQVFGIGIVRTSEDFGAQGELPVNAALLDWLATEIIAQKWDVKRFMKMLVTSAAYRQSSRITPEVQERDPENRLLAHGPRFRMSAEMVRDQALAVSGLLSAKMYGPSVRPARPSSGLNAAFGGNLDWTTSGGDERFRRGLYTEWRRTSPYPSMTTFDAPNREVCTIRRNRTNTPLQALVTMNDPVFIEAAQALARNMVQHSTDAAERVRFGFRACLIRPPGDVELQRLIKMHDEALAVYSADKAKAADMATNPLGAAPKDANVADLAAWTTVANVLLNLDETLMKR